MATTTNNSKTFTKALTTARKLAKSYGNCTVVREVTQRYSTLERKDVLAICAKVGISKFTAQRQFQEVRSGNIRILGI